MEFRNLHLSAFSEVNKVHVGAELEHLAAGNRRVYPTEALTRAIDHVTLFLSKFIELYTITVELNTNSF